MQNLIPDDLLDIVRRNVEDIDTLGKVLTNDAVQVGAEFSWPASTSLLPYNYFPADGRALDRIGYGTLFQQIGTTYGVGDGATTFEIPDRTNAQFYIPVLPVWTAVSFAANYSDLAGGYNACGYTKLANGIVQIRGMIKRTGTPVAAETMFTLPVNFRPTAQVFSNGQGSIVGGTTSHTIEITTAGLCFHTASSAGAWNGTFLSLENLWFDSGVLPTPVATNGHTVVIKVL